MRTLHTLLVLLLAAGCDGPAATESSPRGAEPRVELSPAPPTTPAFGLAEHPPVDGYPGGPSEDGVLGPEWEDELASREVDYAAALRTASLRLRGDLPTLLEVRFVSEAPDPKVAYEAMILTHDQWDEPMATLDYSVGFFMLPLLIGAAHSLLHLFNGVLNGPPAKQTVSFE